MRGYCLEFFTNPNIKIIIKHIHRLFFLILFGRFIFSIYRIYVYSLNFSSIWIHITINSDLILYCDYLPFSRQKKTTLYMYILVETLVWRYNLEPIKCHSLVWLVLNKNKLCINKLYIYVLLLWILKRIFLICTHISCFFLNNINC